MSTLSRGYRKKGGKRPISMKKRRGKRAMSMKKRGGKRAMSMRKRGGKRAMSMRKRGGVGSFNYGIGENVPYPMDWSYLLGPHTNSRTKQLHYQKSE